MDEELLAQEGPEGCDFAIEVSDELVRGPVEVQEILAAAINLADAAQLTHNVEFLEAAKALVRMAHWLMEALSNANKRQSVGNASHDIDPGVPGVLHDPDCGDTPDWVDQLTNYNNYHPDNYELDGDWWDGNGA